MNSNRYTYGAGALIGAALVALTMGLGSPLPANADSYKKMTHFTSATTRITRSSASMRKRGVIRAPLSRVALAA